jgi:hypothetical protein
VFARKEQTIMERRIEVFSTHEIQEGNFEILHGLVCLLVSRHPPAGGSEDHVFLRENEA